MTHVDFVELDGVTVRATSLATDPATGIVTLVVIARGTTDGQRLDEIVSAETVSYRPQGEDIEDMNVVAVDRMTSGERERVITRFAITLAPVTAATIAPTPPRSGQSPLNELERRVEELLELVRALRRAEEERSDAALDK